MQVHAVVWHTRYLGGASCICFAISDMLVPCCHCTYAACSACILAEVHGRKLPLKGADGGLVLLLQARKAEAENQVELARGAVESGGRQSTACVGCRHCVFAAALVHVVQPVW